MKTIICVILATLLCGCAGIDSQKFAEGFANGMNARNNQHQQQSVYQPVKTLDQQCFSGCLQAGYQYGLCQNKCTY